jgi:hypothetical protein
VDNYNYLVDRGYHLVVYSLYLLFDKNFVYIFATLNQLFNRNIMEQKMKIIGFTVLLFTVTVVTSCNKEESGASTLNGKWTSVSVTGKVECGTSTLGMAVANTINSKISEYDLNGVMNFDFGKEEVTVYSSRPGTFYHSIFKWSNLKDNILTITQETGFFECFEISQNGDEFSLKSVKNVFSDIEINIGLALCEMEVRNRGYSSLQEAGVTLSGFRLTVTYLKQ